MKKEIEELKITIIDYDEASFQEKEAKTIEECFVFKDKPTVTWIKINGLHQAEVLEKLGNYYGLHHLTLEDILNINQRPKIEDFGDFIFIVLKILYPSNHNGKIITEQMSLILGANFVISFQKENKKEDIFRIIGERIRNNKGLIRKMGTDYLVYSLLDAIVDNYFVVLEKLGEKIGSLEEGLVNNPTQEILRAIHHLKREMIFLRKSVWPLREVLNCLERRESPLVKESTEIYLRDVHEHTIQVIETIETYRDMISGMLDIYLSSVSNKLNAVMKVLTIIATIFMPLTFMAGVYGMNFKYMPELNKPWGYPLALFMMFCVGVSMVFYFRKKKWL